MKFVKNCENRLFQRPDDAIHPGYDKQTESDFSHNGNFFSNYEPLPRERAVELLEDSVQFFKFTPPMQQLVTDAARGEDNYFVCTANPRIFEGKPTKNPRYLQLRPDLANPRDAYLAEIGTRLRRRATLDKPLFTPVNAVLPGRRNNPPDSGIRPLCVFGPVHYMELPELFMEFICSLTGKSPSTTGAGSEGALTKGPFNALPPIFDLNAALVSYLLTGDAVFVTAAGYLGPRFRVDHDISLLVPEIWSRMTIDERKPEYLIAAGHLEKCRDFEHNGQLVRASRLGWRITKHFVFTFFGRMFNHPDAVFTEEMLRPELQDADIFADGIDNIATAQKLVAQNYFDDGSIELACPPLRALLHIMRDDHFENQTLDSPEIRALFTGENMLASDWYAERLDTKQTLDTRRWNAHARYLEKFLSKSNYADEAARLRVNERLARAQKNAAFVTSSEYREKLHGTIGAQPLKTR